MLSAEAARQFFQECIFGRGSVACSRRESFSNQCGPLLPRTGSCATVQLKNFSTTRSLLRSKIGLNYHGLEFREAIIRHRQCKSSWTRCPFQRERQESTLRGNERKKERSFLIHENDRNRRAAKWNCSTGDAAGGRGGGGRGGGGGGGGGKRGVDRPLQESGRGAGKSKQNEGRKGAPKQGVQRSGEKWKKGREEQGAVLSNAEDGIMRNISPRRLPSEDEVLQALYSDNSADSVVDSIIRALDHGEVAGFDGNAPSPSTAGEEIEGGGDVRSERGGEEKRKGGRSFTSTSSTEENKAGQKRKGVRGFKDVEIEDLWDQRVEKYGRNFWAGEVIGKAKPGDFGSQTTFLFTPTTEEQDVESDIRFRVYQYTEEVSKMDEDKPIQFFFVFVRRPSETPRPRFFKPWDVWRLVGQIAVQASPEEVDKWELHRCLSTKHKEDILQSAGWHAEDIVFVRNPVLDVRFEPQRPFFERMEALLDPAVEDAAPQQSLYGRICEHLGLDRHTGSRLQLEAAYRKSDAVTKQRIWVDVFNSLPEPLLGPWTPPPFAGMRDPDDPPVTKKERERWKEEGGSEPSSSRTVIAAVRPFSLANLFWEIVSLRHIQRFGLEKALQPTYSPPQES
ncbi:hypothetical protein CBR_g47994 [Chara braunii]|uniref:Uncharacterized protein n=1 Tax=Chara braunii TaxID=69332 RepID=A0A388M226_CHABU|nr:hypothetical protein CBR_g47994 [Chara braunii]|eukprot:GBG88523.1 hypothetical protein CBR_g47994 [Chara braunii]